MGKKGRALLAQVCGEIFIVGGTITATAAALFIVDPGAFGSSAISVEPLSPPLALSFLVLNVCAGFVAGTILWIRTMRRFCSRAQLQHYLTRPYIPVASDMIERVFDVIYDTVQKPYRLGE